MLHSNDDNDDDDDVRVHDDAHGAESQSCLHPSPKCAPVRSIQPLAALPCHGHALDYDVADGSEEKSSQVSERED